MWPHTVDYNARAQQPKCKSIVALSSAVRSSSTYLNLQSINDIEACHRGRGKQLLWCARCESCGIKCREASRSILNFEFSPQESKLFVLSTFQSGALEQILKPLRIQPNATPTRCNAFQIFSESSLTPRPFKYASRQFYVCDDRRSPWTPSTFSDSTAVLKRTKPFERIYTFPSNALPSETTTNISN